VQPDGLDDCKEHYLLYRTLLAMMTSARLTPERRQLYLTWYRKHDSEFSRAAARGLEAPPSEYLLWIAQRERYRAAWRAFFREWDVLLAPAFNTLAYPHVVRPFPTDESDFTLTLTINGQETPYQRGLVYPSIATLAGQPATAFPLGRSREGLPIGLQAIGPYLEDLTPIRFAALLAREIGGFTKPEGYDA
jgi:amidase